LGRDHVEPLGSLFSAHLHRLVQQGALVSAGAALSWARLIRRFRGASIASASHGQPLALASKPWGVAQQLAKLLVRDQPIPLDNCRIASAIASANARIGKRISRLVHRPAQHSRVEEAWIKIYLGGVSVRGSRHHRGAVGHAGVAVDGAGAQQEDLRSD
jgi:hypothetical protein